MNKLSTAQREAIRNVAEGKPANARSLASLRKRSMVFDSADGPALTPSGVNAYNRIMASGDGPERLKAMFRF